VARELEILYRPIDDPDAKTPTPGIDTTPQRFLSKSTDYRMLYSDLHKDLQQETEWIQTKLLYPAMEAKESLAPLKKTIKKRENCKLDFERYQSRTDHARQKASKSGRDDPALVKHESDLSAATVVRQLCHSHI